MYNNKNISVMKPINKSELFKRAWEIYRNSFSFWSNQYTESFSDCLKSAWYLLRKEMYQSEGKMDLFFALGKATQPVYPVTQQGYDQFYSNTSYYGD